MSSNPEQPQVLGVSDHAVHLAQGRDQARREAGHGAITDPVCRELVDLTRRYAHLVRTVGGPITRKVDPVIGEGQK